MSRPWRVETISDTAEAIHRGSSALIGSARGAALTRTVRVAHASDRAIVLGSTQPASHVDSTRADRAGMAVVRRRSGGGAVLVGPGLVVWIDVIIPAGDPLWEPDVGRAFWWLGSAWVEALAAAGHPGAEVWRGALVGSRWSPEVCFAGLGPGEVTLDGAKVVGMAQRRTRAGALFQCAAPIVWDPADLLDVLALNDADRRAARTELSGSAAGVGPEVAHRVVPALLALLDRLP